MGSPGLRWFDEQLIIANQGNHFAVAEERVLAEHFPAGNGSSVCGLLFNEIDSAFLRRHCLLQSTTGVQISTRKPLLSRTYPTIWPHGFFSGFLMDTAPAASAFA